MKYKHLILSLSLIMLGPLAHAEEIGSVDTVFKMIGPDHKIVVEAFDDPDVKNVTCYVSRAKTGGIKGDWAWQKIPLMRPFLVSKSGRLNCRIVLKSGKAQGEVVFKNARPWSLSRYRSCAFMMPNATRSLIWLTPTKL